MDKTLTSQGQGDTRQTLLIIDDDAEWTEVLKLYFVDKYQVRVANLAAEAIDIVRDDPPSVIIVDLVMPSIDGFGAIHRIKDASQLKIPTVLLTGWKTPEVEECAASVGCAAVLSKPVSLPALGQVIAAMMSGAAAAGAGRIVH